MDIRNLIPWNRNTPAPRYSQDDNPLLALHREVNRLFDDFFRGFDLPSRFGSLGWPNIEVSETDKEVKVVAELPGMDQKDVDVTLRDGVLTVKGVKKGETNGAVYSERWQGAFQRSVQLSPDVDPDKASAEFRNGVLTVTVAKRADAQSGAKRIPVNG